MRRLIVDDTIVALLPVLDNLDRALAVPEDGSAKDVLVGVGMVRRQFPTVLPVPAPPDTRMAPVVRRSTSLRCCGWRNSCHSAKVSPSMARRRSSSVSSQVKVARAARVRSPAMRSVSVGAVVT